MKYYIYGLYKKNIKYKKNSIDEHLFYIGITNNNNLYYREKNHRREPYNPHKLNIINKYDFILKIIWESETREEAEDRESFLIRWFGKIQDGGILVNVLDSANDTKYARLSFSEEKRKKISKALKKINENKETRIKNRDRNLTVPYEKIMLLIEEWEKNPFETQENFSKRNNISRSKFKDWLRLYRPDCIGLTKRKYKEIYDSIIKNDKKIKNIIQEFSDKSGLTFEKSKSIYYRLKKN